MRVVKTDDPAAAAAELLAERLRDLTRNGKRASLAVSGGTTPWPMLRALASRNLPWPQLDIFQVDERIVPDGHAARNLAGPRNALGDRPVALHPMPVEASDLDQAAADYAKRLPARLDIVQLGLGADGHTASLLPGDSALDVLDSDVALTGVYQGHRRMTLTYPAINRAGLVVWLVTGAEKREAVDRLLAGDETIPAGRVAAEEAVLVADRAALSGRSTI